MKGGRRLKARQRRGKSLKSIEAELSCRMEAVDAFEVKRSIYKQEKNLAGVGSEGSEEELDSLLS